MVELMKLGLQFDHLSMVFKMMIATLLLAYWNYVYAGMNKTLAYEPLPSALIYV